MAIETQQKTRNQIDTLLNKADKALTGTSYFDCEALCVEAIEKAMRHGYFDQAAQAMMPLMEARRQKRVAAVEAGVQAIVDADLPHPSAIVPGMYLVQPPRVGVDGRRLRDAADKRRVPTLVLVREPTTKMGLVPVVAIAQRTFRAKLKPYEHLTVDWMLEAVEALGQVAIELIDGNQSAIQRLEYIWSCVQTIPDHEGLHVLASEAAVEAAQEADKADPPQPASTRKRSRRDEEALLDDDLDDGDLLVDDDDDDDDDDDEDLP